MTLEVKWLNWGDCVNDCIEIGRGQSVAANEYLLISHRNMAFSLTVTVSG